MHTSSILRAGLIRELVSVNMIALRRDQEYSENQIALRDLMIQTKAIYEDVEHLESHAQSRERLKSHALHPGEVTDQQVDRDRIPS